MDVEACFCTGAKYLKLCKFNVEEEECEFIACRLHGASVEDDDRHFHECVSLGGSDWWTRKIKDSPENVDALVMFILLFWCLWCQRAWMRCSSWLQRRNAMRWWWDRGWHLWCTTVGNDCTHRRMSMRSWFWFCYFDACGYDDSGRACMWRVAWATRRNMWRNTMVMRQGMESVDDRLRLGRGGDEIIRHRLRMIELMLICATCWSYSIVHTYVHLHGRPKMLYTLENIVPFRIEWMQDSPLHSLSSDIIYTERNIQFEHTFAVANLGILLGIS